MVVPYGAVRAVFEEDPALLWPVVALLAGRIRVTDEALADAMFLDVTGRTAKRLLDLAGESDEFELPVTQEELAGMVGASRERVNKAISVVPPPRLARAERRRLPHHQPPADGDPRPDDAQLTDGLGHASR